MVMMRCQPKNGVQEDQVEYQSEPEHDEKVHKIEGLNAVGQVNGS